MRYLLDTHVFLWWILDDEQISETAAKTISDGNNEIYLSAAGCWEIAIKAGLGKIDLPKKADIFISDQLATNAIQTLPILASHALYAFNLPEHHKDPFDRMMVAQARLEQLTIITSDPMVSQYDVVTIWE